MTMRTLEDAVAQSRAIVCAGTGGVGKTTVSAAIAVGAALSGRDTLVLTIDPARRLADAFGLEGLESTPSPVDLSKLETEPTASGRLDAMMLDPKPTFDALVDRFARTEAARQRILDNQIYRHVSETLAGSIEYAAMIQVHELVEAGNYELIVVDTPPADHALDFLRAPRRMREFIEGRFVRTLVQPAMSATRWSARLIGPALRRLFSLLDRVAGGGFLDDVAEFLAAVDGLALGFEEKSQRVESFLLGPETSFVLISGAESRSRVAALDFLSKLEEFRVPLAAVVINRMRPWLLPDPPLRADFELTRPGIARDADLLSDQLETEGVGREVVERLAEYASLCARQQEAARQIEEQVEKRGIECRRIPEFESDIDRLSGLLAMADALFGEPSP